jgi:hypothetical protein
VVVSTTGNLHPQDDSLPKFLLENGKDAPLYYTRIYQEMLDSAEDLHISIQIGNDHTVASLKVFLFCTNVDQK